MLATHHTVRCTQHGLQEDLTGCRRQLDKCAPEDPDTLVNTGCVLFKEGKYEAARQKFNDAVQVRASAAGASLAAPRVGPL